MKAKRPSASYKRFPFAEEIWTYQVCATILECLGMNSKRTGQFLCGEVDVHLPVIALYHYLTEVTLGVRINAGSVGHLGRNELRLAPQSKEVDMKMNLITKSKLLLLLAVEARPWN